MSLNMRTVKRKVKADKTFAKCPYCGKRNSIGEDADVCDHLFEIAEDKGEAFFYFFPPEFTESIVGKRIYKGKVY